MCGVLSQLLLRTLHQDARPLFLENLGTISKSTVGRSLKRVAVAWIHYHTNLSIRTLRMFSHSVHHIRLIKEHTLYFWLIYAYFFKFYFIAYTPDKFSMDFNFLLSTKTNKITRMQPILSFNCI